MFSVYSGNEHSASRRKLNILQFWHSIFGTQPFSVSALTVWNSLPDSQHDPAIESERFRWDHLLEMRAY